MFLSRTGQSPVLDVTEITEQPTVSVFPNPSSGKFTVMLSSETENIAIYNLLGKIVFHSDTKNLKYEIDLSGQPKGIYFLKYYGGQRLGTEKIMLRDNKASGLIL